MGCMPSKNAQGGAGVASAKSKISPEELNLNGDIQSSTKAHILDSIKKGDAILLEKTMHTYQVKPTEILGYPEQKKTILHYIAETNFVEGMVLALEYILQHQPQTAAAAINVKDADGNTPAIICCLFDSVETLEVLMKSGHVNINSKNNKGYTAQIIAYESDSPCLNVITSAPASNPKLSSRAVISGSQVMVSPSSSKRLLDVPNKLDLPIQNAPRKSSQLRSVDTIKKDAKLSPDTRLYHILQDMIGKSANFIDEEFPHDNQSVVIEEDNPDYLKDYGELKWLRPTQFMKCDIDSLSLFEGIDLNSVAESALAGCDLYSALAAMTEYPQRLVKVFTTKDINPHGAYSVKFLVSGIPVEIVLDDYVPCYKNSQPLFSRPLTNELWFSLIEKAFAKLYGSYSEISNIPISDAFQLLTGMPSAQFPVKTMKVDELWNLMLDYDKKNYIFCAGNNKSENPKSNRIFSIVRICETEQNRIIKLKNHFEDFTWNGIFSEGSEHWTKELREDLGYYAGDKKYFYMDIEEFVKQFDFISVCHYNENLTRTGMEVNSSPKEAIFFEVEVDREMEAFISVDQKLPIFVEDSSNYDISPVEILVVEELDDGILRRVASGEKDAFLGKHTVYASDKVRTKLSEGKYIIRVKIRWVDGMNHDFVLNVFSPHSLGLKKVKARNHPDFLERVYLDAGSRSNDHYQLSNRCEFASSWCGSHLWLYGVNKGPKTWHLEINFNKIENLRLCKKYRVADHIVRLEIPPKGQGVAFAKRINSDTVEMNWNFNQSWS